MRGCLHAVYVHPLSSLLLAARLSSHFNIYETLKLQHRKIKKEIVKMS